MGSVIGIDPGVRATGYGVVEPRGSRLVTITYGVVRSRPGDNLGDRLVRIFDSLVEVIDSTGPHACAIETVFNAKNPRTSLILGHARGVGILAARSRGLRIFEYSPLEVKKAVVGWGRADKHQVQDMVRLILGIAEKVPQDAADALAVAVCHSNWFRPESTVGARHAVPQG